MIVDHIVGRDSLDIDEFVRANIAPWIPGEPAPIRDAFVNVQDLSLLQNIILTGVYPNGIPINACSFASFPKDNGGSDIRATFYITNNGITAYLNSNVDIRAAQIELDGYFQVPNNMTVSTDLGHGYTTMMTIYSDVLLYDRKGIKIIKSGENFLADIPLLIGNPESITIDKLIFIDIERQRIFDAEVEIIYGPPPWSHTSL